MILNWTGATDDVTPASSLMYFVCSGASAVAIDTVEECEGASQVMAWTANVVTTSITGLTLSTTYYYNVIVKDADANKAIYAGKSESTAANITDGVMLTSPNVSTNNERSGTTRHSFYDTVNSKHWELYLDGSSIKSMYSTNATSWSAGTSQAITTSKFNLHYKAISGIGYVFMVTEENTYDIVLRRGSLGATNITWGSPITVYDGTSSSNFYKSPAITSDDTNLWIAASQSDGFNWTTKARQSTNASNGDLSAWDSASTIGTSSTVLRDIALMPRGGESIYLVYQDGAAVTGYEYATGSWSLASTGGESAWFTVAGAAGLSSTVRAIVVLGSDIYIGGDFTDAGGNASADYIAKWNGTTWSALGSGLNGAVNAIATSGSDIYVGGAFTDAGGNISADRIAKWDGSSWLALDSGLTGLVRDIGISGSDIYVGGAFTDAGGDINADYIAKWNGVTWSALGSGLNNLVYAIAISGSDIYAGGDFSDADGNASADKIAKWNGTTWSAVGSGLNATVYAIVLSGSDVYAGGTFTDAGGNTSADKIAKWNGSSWGAFTSGDSATSTSSTVIYYSLATSGGQVYAGYANGVSVFKPAISGNVISFSATSNDLNEPVILYAEGETGIIKTKKYSSGSWSAATTLYASEGSAPVLSWVSGLDDLVAFWFRAGALEYKKFNGSTWDASPTTLINASVGARYPSCDQVSGGGIIKCMVTSQTSSPFDISTWTITP